MIRRALLSGLVFAAATAHAADSPAAAQNHTVKLTISSSHWETAYGDNHPAEGKAYLVLGAEWTNVIDPELAATRELPTGAKNDNLAEALTLVVDGRDSFPLTLREASTANLDTEDSDIVTHSGGSTDAAYLRKVVGLKNAAGKKSLAYYELPKPGAAVRGDLVFEAPRSEGHALELHYHDPTGGDFVLPLSGKTGPSRPATAAPDPEGAQKNEIFALVAKPVANAASLPAPPPGRRYVTVEFSGRSLLKVEDAYPPYDPAHAKGETFWRPDPAGWAGIGEDLFAIADGAQPCGLEKETALPADFEFPATGWGQLHLVFLVPAGAKALELECFFADYTIPGHEDTVTPKPMHLALVGKAAAAALPEKFEHKITDGPLEFRIVSHRLEKSFAGETAADNEKFLLVDYAVKNQGPDTGRFTVGEQCVWFSDGSETPPDDISARGPASPPTSFALAAGEVRLFEVAWRVPATAKKFEMGLKGNEVAEKFTLVASP
ncbi:MAG TPA: hypothetical protein VHD32_16125 [Candidatus Didemnitutus sp.]|nr:hypothetical protein [Candidatus Didemnitutus sp.]